MLFSLKNPCIGARSLEADESCREVEYVGSTGVAALCTEEYEYMTIGPSDRYVWVAASCGQMFPLRRDEVSGYRVGVTIVLFCCVLVALIEIPLLLFT